MVEITHERGTNGRISFKAVCQNETLGCCGCRFEDGNVVIERLCADGGIADALIRAALNYALQNGVDTASFALSQEESRVLQSACPAVDPQKGVESIAAFFSAKKCG